MSFPGFNEIASVTSAEFASLLFKGAMTNIHSDQRKRRLPESFSTQNVGPEAGQAHRMEGFDHLLEREMQLP
jgi:hypothetical protein